MCMPCKPRVIFTLHEMHIVWIIQGMFKMVPYYIYRRVAIFRMNAMKVAVFDVTENGICG